MYFEDEHPQERKVTPTEGIMSYSTTASSWKEKSRTLPGSGVCPAWSPRR